jgi:hypothetical protein
MATQYRRIDATRWSQEAFLKLPPTVATARGLLLYLMTTGETGYLPGVHRVGVGGLADVLEWSVDDVARCLDELEAAGLVKADRPRRLVWVVDGIIGNVPANPKHLTGWRSEWERLPACPLRNEIAAAYRAAMIAAARPPQVVEIWDRLTVSDTVSDTVSGTVSGTVSDTSQVPKAKSHTPPKAPPNTVCVPRVAGPISLDDIFPDDPPPPTDLTANVPAVVGNLRPADEPEFFELLRKYPSHRRGKRHEAEAAWTTARKRHPAAVILAGLPAWAEYWSQGNPRFTPGMPTWLDGECFGDHPPAAVRDEGNLTAGEKSMTAVRRALVRAQERDAANAAAGIEPPRGRSLHDRY